MYQVRTYRQKAKSPDLISFSISLNETNLFISASKALKRKTKRLAVKYRRIIEDYILIHPEFLTSLKPVEVRSDAPLIIKNMAEAGFAAGVGPMASVAGAIAEFIGKDLSDFASDLIIENGGDIYIQSSCDRIVGIHAGDSPFSGRIGIEIRSSYTPCGFCTSSGTVGHSLSFGKADAVTIVAFSVAKADAIATACANMVYTEDDIGRAIKFASGFIDVRGGVIIVGGKIGVFGDVKLTKID